MVFGSMLHDMLGTSPIRHHEESKHALDLLTVDLLLINRLRASVLLAVRIEG